MYTDRSRVDNFIILKTLGKGSTATVKLAMCSSTSERVALKIVRSDKAFILSTEIDVLKHLTEHRNIIKLLGYSASSVYYKSSGGSIQVSYMVLEYCKNGEIFDYISRFRGFPTHLARKAFLELVSGIEQLHSSGVVHRDLKPENIFFSDVFDIKLGDFGFAAPIQGRDGRGYLSSFKGTRAYMAPEIVERKPYRGNLTDIFSAGIMLFLFVIGRPPFRLAERMDPYYVNIMRKNWGKFWDMHRLENTEISVEFKDLIQKMLAYSPEERSTAAEIMEHPWVCGTVGTQEQAVVFFTEAMDID